MLSCCDEMARDQLKGSPYLIKRQSYTSIVEVGSIVHKELQIIMEGVASNTTEVTLQLYAFICISASLCVLNIVEYLSRRSKNQQFSGSSL